jgi:transportin-3
MDQLHQFLVTVGPKLLQEDKVTIYEAVAWVISSMSMEESAATLRKFAIEILSGIAAIVSQPTPPTSEENKKIQRTFKFLAYEYVLMAAVQMASNS